jgi:hypothetical protein
MNAKGWDVNFKSNMTCELGYKGHLLGAIPATGKLYTINLDFIPNTETLIDSHAPKFSAFVQAPCTLDLWHARLGHLGCNAMTHLDKVAKGISFDSSSPLSTCESCIMAKHPHLLFHATETERASKFLELIHSAICGPIPILTPHFKCYFIVFLDDHTHILNLQLLASKDQALDAWKTICAKWENLSGLCVKVFRLDNGGEFINDAFTVELESAGIECQCSAPYAHQQNCKAEHIIRTIKGCMYAMLDHARLPWSLWGEAALTVAYLFNRSKSCALPPGKTPYEMLNKSQPTLAHLRVFGARCFA